MFFSKQILYLQIFSGHIKAKEILSGKNLNKKCSALSHPRTLMGDFMGVESCFKEIVNEITPKAIFNSSPIIVVHLRPEVEGGYTNVELRAFKEAAFGAGAREVRLPNNKKTLSSQQITELNFSQWDNA